MSYLSSGAWSKEEENAAATLLFQISGEADCWRKADKATEPMFAKRQEVRNNWNPTGTYTPHDLHALVVAANNMMRDAGVGILDKALADNQMPSGRDELMAARNQIHDQQGKSVEYIDAWKAALAQGITQIAAPGLKRFIIGAMEVTQAAAFVASKVACMRPWWLDFLVGAMKFFMKAADFILSIPGIIYNAAKAAIDIVDKTAQIIKYSMYAGAGVGAWWLWSKYGKKKR